MDLSSGYPLWLIRQGLPYNYPYLASDISTDVLVMGGGISGALSAYYLMKAGIDCTVIDARTIGLGSTSASTSLLQYEIDVSLTELTDKIGKADAEYAYHLSARAIDELELIAREIGFSEYTRCQSVYFAARKKDERFISGEYKARAAAGFKVDLLEPGELKSRYGFHSSAAILSRQGAETNAYSFTHALLQNFIRQGGNVYDRTQAAEIDHGKRSVKVVTDRGCKIRAKKIIYATGYEAVNYIRKGYVNLQSTYAVCTEQMPGDALKTFTNTLFWNTADPYFYMRITSDNRILIGGRDEPFYNPDKRDKLLKSKTRKLAGDFNKLFPAVEFNKEFSWTGTFGTTEDGLPFIGPYKSLPHGYFALGFGGNGITFSQIAAEVIPELIRENKMPERYKIFSFNRIK